MCHACNQANAQMANTGSRAAQRIDRDPTRVNAFAPTRHPGSKPPRQVRVAHRRRNQRAARRRNRA